MQRESCGCFLGNMQRHDHSPETWLDEADRKRLAAALAGAREARVYRRLEALLLVAEGHSMAEAARRCRVNRSSVHRWLAQYKVEHEATALIDRPRSGRPRLHRQAHAAAAGGGPGTRPAPLRLPGHELDGAAAGARPGREGPRGQPADPAAPAARGGLSLEAPALRLCRARGSSGAEKGGITRRLKAGWHRGDRLLCLDWTLLRLFPPLRATWALKGAQAVVPITGRNAKRVLFGAIDLRSARRVVLIRSHAGQAGAQAFLRALRRRYRRAGWLWLLTDRASAHTAPQTLALATRLRIRFVWLPRQAPELSPMDQLWRELKLDLLQFSGERFCNYPASLSN